MGTFNNLARDSGGLEHWGWWSSSRSILKEEPRGREREESQTTPRTLARTTERMGLPRMRPGSQRGAGVLAVLSTRCFSVSLVELQVGLGARWGFPYHPGHSSRPVFTCDLT